MWTQWLVIKAVYVDVAVAIGPCDALRSDRAKFAKFFHGMLDAGIYLAPSQFEAGFLSTAHSEADLDFTIRTASTVLRRV